MIMIMKYSKQYFLNQTTIYLKTIKFFKIKKIQINKFPNYKIIIFNNNKTN